MRIRTIALAVAALSSTVAVQSEAGAHERLAPEAQLAKLLRGRVAGTPVNCISLYAANRTQVIDKTAIVYDSGGTLYVNRPHNPQDLDDDDILVTELRGTSQLCNVDVVKLRDRTSFFYDGFISLGDFVPYRRVASN